MSQNKDDWKDPFEQEENSAPDGTADWKDIFGEEPDDELAKELGLNDPPPAIPSEGYPIESSYFDANEDDHAQTAVIPPEVRDISAYTSGEPTPITQADIHEHIDAAVADENEDNDDDDMFEIDIPDFDEDFEEDEEDESMYRRPIRRTRRKRTGLMGGVMYATFVLALGTIFAFLAWMAADDVLALTREDFSAEVIVPENFTIDDIANELHAAGLIENRWLFRQMARLFNYYDRIEPGVYQVASADYRALIGRMNQRTGVLTEVRVMIPEGRMMREMFQILETHGVASVESLTYVAENVAFDQFEFLDALPMSTMNRLEGYLFPDTYTFFLGQNPESVIRTMLSNFEVRMNQNDIFELVEQNDRSLHEIINIAAMIEGEMANWDEAPRISSVIHNRLRQGMHLGIDATIQYLLPERTEFVTFAMLDIESPYNTYRNLGLPYGPVSNPGMVSILAALQPESTNFLFYALHVDGHHHFTTSYAEHNAFLNTPNFVHYGWGR